MPSPDSSPPLNRTQKITSWIAKGMTGIGVVLGVMWTLITYAIPDPSVLGFSFISWKNVVLLVSTFLFLGVVSIGWQIRNLMPVFRGLLQFFMVAVLSFGFFTLGTEYAKPSFEFAKLQSKIVENDGSNLLGKRMEVLDNVRIELDGCESIGRFPNCTFVLTNLNVDRFFRFDGSTRLFDESGGPLNPEKIRVGQVEDTYRLQFQLIRNVPTRVTLAFQQSSDKLNKTPAIKLAFQDVNSELLTLKFSEIVMR
ncbi:hypothetical protein K5D56_12720 [Pseudomonas cichorii]|uniref:Uncharacterized protein n=1 Tax=Pseudomonas lijiangensis TaxID=2995658 RepID=A0ABX8HS39_9PSED|nr:MULTISPECIES: hypothetical protein [Pseudomonas syringae group]MBX8501698.1 hypothetical protein [Pseudomonas lijiangensis]MBX8506533.1 hypothetical protein [Pseudomonas lijiangensis]MBX8522267.1 hypothetical protein [Pseudomonas cichorii]MBX8542439.1 hypothetical protein [Pseudomonas cichorii]MBX8547327.1 hypothetical protein [Pseudomonas cichorii]